MLSNGENDDTVCVWMYKLVCNTKYDTLSGVIRNRGGVTVYVCSDNRQVGQHDYDSDA